MDKQLRIELLENRAAILETNGRENKKIVSKIRRKVRNLKKDSE